MNVSRNVAYAKPRVPFCWVCSKQLVARKVHRVAVVDGVEHPVHVFCAKLEGLTLKDGAHLAEPPAEQTK